jgi:hypothetical protein
MKTEIEKSVELQKKKKFDTVKPLDKKTNLNHITSDTIEASKDEIKENNLFQIKITNENTDQPKKSNGDQVEDLQFKVINFKEPVEEKKDTYLVKNNAFEQEEKNFSARKESPKPAPPVADEAFEIEVVYKKSEREAKEKNALELAQKLAAEQKEKEDQEIFQKKIALSELEDKFDDIASKYIKE